MDRYKHFCLKICTEAHLRILFTTPGIVSMIAWDVLFLVQGFVWAHTLFIVPALTMIVVIPGNIMQKNIRSALIYVSAIVLPTLLFFRAIKITDRGESAAAMFAVSMILYVVLHLVDINTSKG